MTQISNMPFLRQAQLLFPKRAVPAHWTGKPITSLGGSCVPFFLGLIATDCGEQLSQRGSDLLATAILSTNLIGYDRLGLADVVQSHFDVLQLHGCDPYKAVPGAAEWVVVNAIAGGWIMPQDFWASTEGACNQQECCGENQMAFIDHCMLEAVRLDRKRAVYLNGMLKAHNDYHLSTLRDAA
jgi:hypothetical protein